MTFFDKLKFTIKNKHKQENQTEIKQNLSSGSPALESDPYRVLVFRECERRGRKLLLDSSCVEQVSLSTLNIHNDVVSYDRRGSEFVELSQSYGYKYKKPSNDVASLGEMMFGSVAMTYRGVASAKIHAIPAPRSLMFTTIVHAPGKSHCRNGLVDSTASSRSSIPEVSQHSSNSDSRLYQKPCTDIDKPYTYPVLPRQAILEPILRRSLHCRDAPGSDTIDSSVPCSDCKRDSSFNSLDGSNPSFYGFSLSDTSKSSPIPSNSSLNSLRNRWTNAHLNTEENEFRSRAKLGIALVFDLSNSNSKVTEKFVFDHSIMIESVLNRLRSSVETAYVKKEHFVDIIYTSFRECKDSLRKLVDIQNVGQPTWLTLKNGHVEFKQETSLMGNLYMHFHENIGGRNGRSFLNAPCGGFLADFREVLETYDTKNTNFFISTLLTAVLTHHLSWVNNFADEGSRTSNKAANFKKQDAIWKQLNDLNGLLGCPLKSVKTVVNGSESQKHGMTLILRVLTYFVRCCEVVENIYDADFEDITSLKETNTKYIDDDNFDSGIDCTYNLGEEIFVDTSPKVDVCSSVAFTRGESAACDSGSVSSAGDFVANMRNTDPLKTGLYALKESPSAGKCVAREFFASPLQGNRDTSSARDFVVGSQKVAFDNPLKLQDCSSAGDFVAASRNEVPKHKAQDCQMAGEFVVNAQNDVPSECHSLNASGNIVAKSQSFLKLIEGDNRRVESDSLQRNANPGVLKRNKTCFSNLAPKLYPDLEDLAKMENVSMEDLRNPENDLTMFVEKILNREKVDIGEKIKKLMRVKETRDEGCDIVDFGGGRHYAASRVECEKQTKAEDVRFVLGDNEELVKIARKTITTKSTVIELEVEEGSRGQGDADAMEGGSRRLGSDVEGSRTLRNSDCAVEESRRQSDSAMKTSRRLGDSGCDYRTLCEPKVNKVLDFSWIRSEFPMPRSGVVRAQKQPSLSVWGGVSNKYTPEVVIQGVTEPRCTWDSALKRDLSLSAHHPVLHSDVTEALCILGDMTSWEVSLCSHSSSSISQPNKSSGVRVGMSQIVADMLESFTGLAKLKVSPEFCLKHLECKLREIYRRSQALSELLRSPRLFTLDALVTALDVSVTDVVLLFAVATTHSPQLARQYGVTLA